MGKRRSKSKDMRAPEGLSDEGTTEVEVEVDKGGLAVYEDGPPGFMENTLLFHLVPHEVASSLRFFVSRMQPDDWEGEGHVLAVTSALSGEGVTTVARSLAAILANDLERSVCLVETNWWSAPPREPSDVDPPILGRRGGLAEVLAGSSSIDDSLMRTSDPRLFVLTSGDLPVGRRPAAISSGGFHDVVDSLAKDFDTVVLDVPPVLKTSEAAAITREASSTLLVVRRGVTTDQQLEAAIEELDGSNVLGVVVNRAPGRVPKIVRRLGLAV